MWRPWEKLSIEDRERVMQAIFSGFERYRRGADELSINGVNLTSEQLSALEDLARRHDRFRSDGGWVVVGAGELAKLRARIAELESYIGSIAQLVDMREDSYPFEVVEGVETALDKHWSQGDDE